MLTSVFAKGIYYPNSDWQHVGICENCNCVVCLLSENEKREVTYIKGNWPTQWLCQFCGHNLHNGGGKIKVIRFIGRFLSESKWYNPWSSKYGRWEVKVEHLNLNPKPDNKEELIN